MPLYRSCFLNRLPVTGNDAGSTPVKGTVDGGYDVAEACNIVNVAGRVRVPLSTHELQYIVVVYGGSTIGSSAWLLTKSGFTPYAGSTPVAIA